MSLKLKRNLPLVLSLVMVVLALVLFFGNLRIGATNIRLGTWAELRLAAAADQTTAYSSDTIWLVLGETDADIADTQILLEDILDGEDVY